MYKCALCSKGIFSLWRSRLVFVKNSRAGSLVKASRRSTAASSSVMFFASGTMLSKTAPQTIRRWLRVRRSSLDNFCRNIFSPVPKLPDFLLPVLNLGCQFLAGFLSWFRHGCSLLSARRHRKRTVDFLGCPFLCCYTYPSVSFEVLVLSKILFNNSSPLILSEIPKPGIDTNSSVSVEIRNPRPFS